MNVFVCPVRSSFQIRNPQSEIKTALPIREFGIEKIVGATPCGCPKSGQAQGLAPGKGLSREIKEEVERQMAIGV